VYACDVPVVEVVAVSGKTGLKGVLRKAVREGILSGKREVVEPLEKVAGG
jgi:hypothetical protein